MRIAKVALAALFAVGGAALSGCNTGSSPRPPATTTVTTAPTSTTSTTARTQVVFGKCTLGVPATFSPGLKLLVAPPTTSTGPLGTGNGYAPRNGYYLSFQVTASDVGSTQVEIDPGFNYSASHTGFVVDETGATGVTVTSGNAPFDGSLTVLDTSPLEPGNSVNGPIIFDVPHTHGKLSYMSSGHLVCTWPF
ncbi:MAG: hypothetical protein ACRDY2_02250 [Acidimicrobiales bacterium]